jgi:2-polyprenyl-3-methyl-5-hydroxy-6-metoxy-1,4-benzoquinol methylase
VPAEMALQGTHERILAALNDAVRLAPPLTALDIGAGRGALAAKLREAGLSVSACDVLPGSFDVPGIECRQIDETGVLPYDDDSFDVAVAAEVLEHVDGHDRFFAEAARVLKPGATLLFTTPNILSLKSRLLFLLSGTFYSFGPLVPFTTDPVSQHISPFTLNRYAWQLSQHELHITAVRTDKFQTTSLLLGFLAPLTWLATRLMFGADRNAAVQNSAVPLFGRKLMILSRKSAEFPAASDR